MSSDKPNISHANVDFLAYARRNAHKDDFHKKRMDMVVYTPVEFDYLDTPAKIFIKSARQNHFIQENIFNNASVRRSALERNTNSAFTGSYTEKPFWYQQNGLREIGIHKGCQPVVDFDAADNCRLYVTTMKAMNFQDDIPSTPIVNFKDHNVLVFDLTSMQEATEKCLLLELVGEPLRPKLTFTHLLEHTNEILRLGERMFFVKVDKFGVVGKSM